MSDENVQVDDVNKPADTDENHVEVDPVEQAAREQGWRPKEEYEGDPAKWVSAETFVSRAPLFEKIDELNKKIRALDQNNKALVGHYQKVREVEYNRALEDLKRQHRTALEEGELIIADEIKDQIAELRTEQKAQVVQPAAVVDDSPSPEFTAWVGNNTWYKNDEELRDVADGYGLTLAKKGLPPKEVLLKVAEHIRKAFPEKFRNPNKDKPSGVEGKSSLPRGNGKPSLKDSMSSEELSIMKRVIKSVPGMTEESYLKDYADIQGVK